ncbi:hypothetical protein BC832DRAFT_566947 [Gaertneriomyces semiglobifer]|nr:hypothetical protein BC832DRAFT_566947 [Gaertneriomyces semiglobifer]
MREESLGSNSGPDLPSPPPSPYGGSFENDVDKDDGYFLPWPCEDYYEPEDIEWEMPITPPWSPYCRVGCSKPAATPADQAGDDDRSTGTTSGDILTDEAPRLWPANFPSNCLFYISYFLSLNDLTCFSLTSRSINASMKAIRNRVLASRLTQGRHLSADLVAAYRSGLAPYHVLDGIARADVYKLLRRDQRCVETSVGALVTFVSRARADKTCLIGRTESGEWDEALARREAVRALILIWPVVDDVKQILETMRRTQEEGGGRDGKLDSTAMHSEVRQALAPYSSATLEVIRHMLHPLARHLLTHYLITRNYNPPVPPRESMASALLIPGRDALVNMLSQSYGAVVADECLSDFETYLELLPDDWCPLRECINAEIARREKGEPIL